MKKYFTDKMNQIQDQFNSLLLKLVNKVITEKVSILESEMTSWCASQNESNRKRFSDQEYLYGIQAQKVEQLLCKLNSRKKKRK